jgi:hypothetical protein
MGAYFVVALFRRLMYLSDSTFPAVNNLPRSDRRIQIAKFCRLVLEVYKLTLTQILTRDDIPEQ